jgi:hypothetical protein
VRGKLRLVASPTAAAAEGRLQAYSAAAGAAAARHDLAVAPGLHRKSNVNSRVEMSAHDRGDAHLHADRQHAAAAERPAHKSRAIEKLAEVPA